MGRGPSLEDMVKLIERQKEKTTEMLKSINSSKEEIEQIAIDCGCYDYKRNKYYTMGV